MTHGQARPEARCPRRAARPGEAATAKLVDERREGTRHLFMVNPDGFAATRHAAGWRHFLARLVSAAAGDDPCPDPWQDAALSP